MRVIAASPYRVPKSASAKGDYGHIHPFIAAKLEVGGKPVGKCLHRAHTNARTLSWTDRSKP